MSEQPARPSISDIVGSALAAIEAEEMTVPDLVPDSYGIRAVPLEGDSLPGFSIASDPETGLLVLLPSYQACRGSLEYEGHFENFLEQFRMAEADGLPVTDAGEVALDDIMHVFLHDAFAANEKGGDLGLDTFIQRNLLPHLVEIWALTDAYSQLVHGKLPVAGDRPLKITMETYADLDPYSEDGRTLAVQVWSFMELEMHDVAVHAQWEVREAKKLKPASRKARRHAQRPKR
ncbi:MAG TPA: hypothetical protein VF885_24065 [Arthrobacter sp.]